jgi:hypothetical protein
LEETRLRPAHHRQNGAIVNGVIEVPMRNVVVTLAVAAAAIGLGLTARGQVQSVPGPGSGVVTVTGRVEVVDGVVRSSQNGDWKVTLANVPDVRVVNTPTVAQAPLSFLKTGTTLTVTWQDGSRETIRVGQLGGGGWVRSETPGRRAWMNLDAARAVEGAN